MLHDLWRQPDVRRALAMRDIGTVYRHLQDAGVPQRKIASLTGQSQSEISEILAGRTVNSYSVLVRIASGLGIPPGHMGLAYVDTPVGWHTTRLTARPPLRPEPSRSRAWSPRRWGPSEIRALREAMRMSVREFARHLGVSDRMVSKWEAGAVPRPVNQAALDTALARADHASQARFAGWSAGDGVGARLVEGVHWLLQVPLVVPNLEEALSVAANVAQVVSDLPQAVTDDAVVSAIGREYERFAVFCGRALPDGRACRRRRGHQDCCTQTTSVIAPSSARSDT